MEKGNYKLVGVINPLGDIPELVFPVFGKDRRLFLQVCELSTIIDSFSEITDVDHMAMIRPLSEIKRPLYGEVDDTYSVGSDQLIAFQSDSDTVFFGNMKSFDDYIKKNPVESDILRDQIESLREDEMRARNRRRNQQRQK